MDHMLGRFLQKFLSVLLSEPSNPPLKVSLLPNSNPLFPRLVHVDLSISNGDSNPRSLAILTSVLKWTVYVPQLTSATYRYFSLGQI